MAAGLTELKSRIRQEEIAGTEKVNRNEQVLVWDDLTKPPHQEPAWMVMPDEVLDTGITWRDVARAARERRKRLTGSDYSTAWYKALQAAVGVAEGLGIGPEDLARPANCLTIIRSIEQQGLAPGTVTQRVSTLASALTSARKSGLYPYLKHCFGDVDYRSTAGRKAYHQPTEKEFTILKQALPGLPRHHRLAIELMLLTGARVGAATSIKREDLEDTGVWLTGKGKPSYWVPLAEHLHTELINEWVDFASPQRIRMVLSEVVPGVPPHGLRHLYASTARACGVPVDALAALMDHSLPASLQTAQYGSWPRERLRIEQEKITDRLNLWTKTNIS